MKNEEESRFSWKLYQKGSMTKKSEKSYYIIPVVKRVPMIYCLDGEPVERSIVEKMAGEKRGK